jgi:hypothetical protein
LKLSWVILLLTMLVACVDNTQQKTTGRRNFFSGDTLFNPNLNSGGSGTSSQVNLAHDLKWFSNNEYLSKINLYPNTSSFIFIRGNKIHQFLSVSGNYKTYCLALEFNSAQATKMVVKATPISLNNFSNGTIERTLRFNLTDSIANRASCLDENEEHVYAIKDVCPTCTNYINGSIKQLYQSQFVNTGTGSKWIIGNPASGTPSFTSLLTQLNFNNTGNTQVSSCSDIQCKAQNLDCCLEGQCVKDGAIRTSAVVQDPDGFQVVQAMLAANPNIYLNYPQYFYVCPNSVGSGSGTSSGSGGGTGGADPVQTLASLIEDYQCIEEMKTLSSSDPFHLAPINEDESYSVCNTSDEDDNMYFEKVLTRLYDRCGCASGELSQRIDNCPKYTYKIISTDTQGNPTQIACKTPEPENNLPFQNLNVTVNSRSAPHRFFDSVTTEPVYDLSTDAIRTERVPEGEEFLYNDAQKMLPQNGSFNMNSVLGQMSVMLDKALPAKMVKVKYDDVYIISTTSGFYTPCPECARDSWYTSFTAWPNTTFGNGVQAYGHTTQRDAYGYNTSQANYEDMIFGRACFVPPTMLPMSHAAMDDVSEQRQNRLMTQAAMYMNGYQRDWYGFNKGAVIGSFDGVTWFAIGNGRIVKATSDKLFIAINAPFADLASATNHVVAVQQYEGISTGATFDYNPNLAIDHPAQNKAATCQNYHSCSKDSDCITQLGWEYVCGDVKEIKTSWPLFDSEGYEIAGESQELLIEQILQQATLPSGTTKRCIYRGAGSPCNRNAESGANENRRKIESCAPNFYCASLDEEVFNDQVARFAAPLQNLAVDKNHFYGQGAKILGRPLEYISSSLQSMPTNVAESIQSNYALFSSESETGICRPGRATREEASNPMEAQRTADSQLRTDYISQIGGCDSNSNDYEKYISCPVLDTEGNYVSFKDNFLSAFADDETQAMTTYSAMASKQNSCGGESLTSDGNNVFERIESGNLNDEETLIADKTLAKNACLRRAGSICHTDLDCSPNKLHAEESSLYTKDFFGNEPERRYWEESLICGQAAPKPNPYDANFKTYKFSDNRCCREIGKDLSIYSEKTPEVIESYDIQTTYLSYLAPDHPKRYSRFSIATDLGDGVSGSTEKSAGNLTGIINLLTKNQWKPISQVAQRTCCGGGWVRKFADNTTDWKNTSRLGLDVTNFKCLNYRSPMINTTNPLDYNIKSSWLSRDYNLLCSGAGSSDGQNGCMEVGMSASGDGFSLVKPTLDETTSAKVRTDSKFRGTIWAPFAPRAIDNSITFFDHSKTDGRLRGYNFKMYTPAYVDPTLITLAKIIKTKDNTEWKSCAITSGACPAYTTLTNDCRLCVDTDAGTMEIVQNGLPGGDDWGVELTFTPPGTMGYDADQSGAIAGNYLYYLDKLARLELIGIPQIYYEPFTCTDNHKSLVPGIFNDALKTIFQFQNDSQTFKATSVVASGDPTNPQRVATSSLGLQHDKVFSPSEFKCCSQLGQKVASKNLCCSGHGVEGADKKWTCKLPMGADLNVYFNRFITSEGSETTAPGGGFVDGDFNENTGEPKMTDDVYRKLNALGAAYCESGKTRRGGAFGRFKAEPSTGTGDFMNPTNVSIVDSYTDLGTSNSSSGSGGTAASGYASFAQGFRWNNHVYCDQ